MSPRRSKSPRFTVHSPTPPTLLHSPHIFPYLPPHPNTLPTAPLTSLYTPTHFPSHPMHSPTPLPTSSPTVWIMWQSYDVTFINLTVLWKSPIKFFTTTGNLKSCFGVGNVDFQCIKAW